MRPPSRPRRPSWTASIALPGPSNPGPSRCPACPACPACRTHLATPGTSRRRLASYGPPALPSREGRSLVPSPALRPFPSREGRCASQGTALRPSPALPTALLSGCPSIRPSLPLRPSPAFGATGFRLRGPRTPVVAAAQTDGRDGAGLYAESRRCQRSRPAALGRVLFPAVEVYHFRRYSCSVPANFRVPRGAPCPSNWIWIRTTG